MGAEILYAIGTLLSWAGWFFAIKTVVILSQLLAKVPGLDSARLQKGLIACGAAAGVLLISSALTPMKLEGAQNSGFRFPLVWFVLPWSAWLFVMALGLAAMRIIQALLTVNPDEKSEKGRAGLGWVAAAIIMVVLYRLDPDNRIQILRGGIDLQPTTAVGIILSLVAATFAMIVAGKETTSRGFASAFVTQSALLAGSVIFGLPFAFLIITSFKEDRDMSSPSGIVWVPKVQETVPFYDKRDPLFEATYQGQKVEGNILQTNADGTVHIDIQKPLAIRGTTFDAPKVNVKQIPKSGPVVEGTFHGQPFRGFVDEEMNDGHRRVQFLAPETLKGQEAVFEPFAVEPVRHVGLKWQNYPDALSYLPPETSGGLVYIQNTLTIVVFSVIGTILSSAIVAYAFSRLKFPGKDPLFAVLLSTMMLPGAVTLMPQFLIFRQLGWIDTLLPLWVPSFFGSAFNIFMLRQFFMQIPMELEDAAKIDGCNYLRSFWSIMMPLIKPALAVVAVTTFVGAWNNFMGPLIYINSPEHMPLSYALKLYSGDRGGEPGLLMAFATLCMLPVLGVFFFAQRYFIEGVTLSGLGGR